MEQDRQNPQPSNMPPRPRAPGRGRRDPQAEEEDAFVENLRNDNVAWKRVREEFQERFHKDDSEARLQMRLLRRLRERLVLGFSREDTMSIADRAREDTMSIADRAREASNLFESWRALFQSDSPSMDDADNQIFKFNLWASNNYLFESPRASMDWRLRNAPLLLSALEDILDELKSNLSVQGQQTSKLGKRSDGGGHPTEPKIIEGTLDQLFRFSRAIRRSGILHRFIKIANFAQFDTNGNNITEEFRLAATRIIQHHLKECSASPELQIRLVDTICLRKQNFAYLNAKKARLTTRHQKPTRPLSRAKSVLSPSFSITAPISSTSKTRKMSQMEPQLTSHRSIMTATTLQDTIPIKPSVQSSAAIHESDTVSEDWDLPKPPVVPFGQKEWECPYCLLVCSAREFKGDSWKKHILADIMPYICVLDSCSSSNSLYQSANDWLRHMNHEHAIQGWTCLDTSHATKVFFDSQADFKHHIHECHPAQFDTSGIDDLIDACFDSRPRTLLFTNCPFCPQYDQDEDLTSDLTQHIEQHLLTFAQISITGFVDDDYQQSEVADSTDKREVAAIQMLSETVADGLEPEFFQEDGLGNDLDSLEALAAMVEPTETDEDVWLSYSKSLLPHYYDPMMDPILMAFKAQQRDPQIPCFMMNTPVRNKDFYGRQDILSKLDDCLLPSNDLLPSSQPNQIRVGILCGMPGLGKTEIAIEYAFSRKNCFDAIFWIRADDLFKLESDLAQIAIHLGIQDPKEPDDKVTNKGLAIEWLCNPSKIDHIAVKRVRASWLVVFDNADEPDILAPYSDIANSGAVLITSRSPLSRTSFSHHAICVDVSFLSISTACSSGTLPLNPINTTFTKHSIMSEDAKVGPCHVHNAMRVRKPSLQDTLPNELCVLCNRPFCANHKGIRDGVCEINHVTYYYKHPDAENIYRTYEDWRKDHADQMSRNEEEKTEREEREPLGGDI